MADHLDPDVLLTLQQVVEAEYPQLLDAFLLDSEGRLTQLQATHQRGETDSLRRAAHSFKGSCSNMGAALLAEYCQALEEAAQSGQLDKAGELVRLIECEFAIVRTLCRAERQRFSGAN